MCIPKKVDRGARESDEDSTSSSEGPRIMSGMSNSKTVLENTKVVTTASTATTDTVSLNQATLPGTSNARKEPADCDCGEHKGTVFVDKIYALEVDELYQLLFTENESLLNFLKTAKRSDLRYESWTAIEHGERRKKKRTARYTVELSSTLGPKCTHVTEVQVVAEVGPNAVDGYTITKDAVNAGVPYADSFSVFCTYCITRVGPKKSRLKVHGEIVYRKSVMGVFKSIIERMTLSGMHDYYKHLDKYLSSCGSKEETSRNGAGSDWISEFPESEMDTQLESESLQSQDPPSVEIRLRAELVTQRNEIRAQAASLREIQKSLRLVVLLLVLIFVLCISNTYRYSQLDFNSIASGQSFTKPEL
uniref:VASt domain-containing protein n=2 Tax=Bursaphelenchus xylophilus TaxID=6326 RepID=A0A1I7SDP9_BURXY